jgi:hypothetical protein
MQTWMARSDFNKAENGDARNANVRKQGEAADLVTGWTNINDNYANAQKSLGDEFGIMARRKVWPMLYADVMAALPQSTNRNTAQPIVITSVDDEYKAHLSAETTDTPLVGGTGGGGGGPGAAAAPVFVPGQGLAPVAAPPPGVAVFQGGPPAAAPAAPATPAAPASGEPEHGFIVQVTGYIPNGGYETVTLFERALIARTSGQAGAVRPYIFSSFKDPGITIHAPLPTAGTAFGAGGGFAPVPVNNGNNGDRPWGGASHGPYWSMFAPDLVNWHPQEAPQPGMVMGPGMVAAQATEFSDFTFPVDLYTTRAKTPITPASMNGAWSFQLRFKMHLKDDVK